MIKKLISILILSLFASSVKADIFLPARIINPEYNHPITPNKIDLALTFAFKLLDDHDYISAKVRDSIAEELYQSGDAPELLKVAQFSNANSLLFVRVNVLENIIRTDIDIVNVKDTTNRSRGHGYALVRYFQGESGEKIYDPSLLTSIQRALAVAMSDSLIFVDSVKGFNVRPLPTLVIGSIYYVDYEVFKDWEIIRNHVVSSFSAVESIFEAANKSEKFVVYDIATRDSIYTKFNLYGIENYAAPSEHELDALYKADIDYFITGSMERSDEGAQVTLSLYKIQHRGLMLINNVEGILEKDKMDVMQNLMRKLTRELIE